MGVGTDFLSVRPTGTMNSVEDFEGILIFGDRGSERQILPARRRQPCGATTSSRRRQLLRFDGIPAIGLAISTVQGGNVVTMGGCSGRRFKELVRWRRWAWIFR